MDANLLARLDPAAAKWAAGYKDTPSAWPACVRGDWMLWYAEKVGVAPKLLGLAAVDCIALVKCEDVQQDAIAVAVLAKAQDVLDAKAQKGDIAQAKVGALFGSPPDVLDAVLNGHIEAAAVVTQVARLALIQGADAKALAALLAQCADAVRVWIDADTIVIAEKG